ncbi:hypothetical protein AVMA1855_02820 [Acidovorax sp. SUPP1855]|uniref:hypothetical protein n=1 Tax=Acidovorax sp. SUPP1855 TaxID=431774 RepID=UPI0023DE599D|nr:hypothetical protein [Acidovorax sp. SUPP1855]GKS83038.1 hypothetical protein AVMA1855_02820 [Acidovorax sp. SUPP1855]
MNFIVCNVQTLPCPADQQAFLSFSRVEDFAALGLTPEVILAAYVFGAGSVVTWWFLGFVISLATKLISKA